MKNRNGASGCLSGKNQDQGEGRQYLIKMGTVIEPANHDQLHQRPCDGGSGDTRRQADQKEPLAAVATAVA